MCEKVCCISCGGEVILQEEGGTLEAYGYGYGTFICQDCGKRSSYYGEGTMLKGSGDFSPKDPEECPEDCPHYAPEDLAFGYCHSHIGCIYAPKKDDD